MQILLILALLVAWLPSMPQDAHGTSTRVDLSPLEQTQPVYPPIAKAAHVSGEVKLQVQIGTDGHVTNTKPLSGPAMLIGAAEDCVRQWIYAPTVSDGKTVSTSTMVTIKFSLPAPAIPNDEQIASKFFPVDQACVKAVTSKADTGLQANLCKQAADIALTFSDQERFIERRGAFVYATTALRRDKQLNAALEYANRDVAVVQQGHDDGSGSSAAYGVRAQAEAELGDLSAASADLDKAEEYERSAIAEMNKMDPEFVKHAYIPTLRGLLNYHAQVLSMLGKTDQAKSKAAEAQSL